ESGYLGIKCREPGTMGLPKRGSRNGSLVNTREHRFEGNTELRFGERADCGERYRRNFILEAFKLSGNFRWQHIQSGRHVLSDLDHEATQINSQHIKALRNAPHPLGSATLCQLCETDSWQENFIPPG